eukprot:UN22975
MSSGDDAIELYENLVVIDAFGDVEYEKGDDISEWSHDRTWAIRSPAGEYFVGDGNISDYPYCRYQPSSYPTQAP